MQCQSIDHFAELNAQITPLYSFHAALKHYYTYKKSSEAVTEKQYIFNILKRQKSSKKKVIHISIKNDKFIKMSHLTQKKITLLYHTYTL